MGEVADAGAVLESESLSLGRPIKQTGTAHRVDVAGAAVTFVTYETKGLTDTEEHQHVQHRFAVAVDGEVRFGGIISSEWRQTPAAAPGGPATAEGPPA